MPKVWKWTAKDKHGKRVPAADGKETFTSRGPTTEQEMREAAQLLLNNQRLKLIRAGIEDPGYQVDTIEALPDDDTPTGWWQPRDAAPLQIGGSAAQPPEEVAGLDPVG